MSILAKVRKDLMSAGFSEAEAFANGGLTSIFDDLQALRKERNEAKIAALKKIDQDYSEPEATLDRRYALMVKLSSRNTSK